MVRRQSRTTSLVAKVTSYIVKRLKHTSASYNPRLGLTHRPSGRAKSRAPLNSSVMHKAGFLVLTLLLASCTSGRSALPERTTVLPPEEVTHVLQQCSRETPKPVTGAWAVSPAVVAQLEQDLSKLPSVVSQACCGKGSSVANPRLYYRQYAGVEIEGRRYV